MLLDDQKIKEILLKGSYITEEDIAKGEEFQKKYQNTTFMDFLNNEGLITKDLLGQAVAEFYKVSYANIQAKPPSQEQILKINDEIAKKYRIILYHESPEEVIIGTDDVNQQGLMEVLQPLFPRKKIIVAYILPEDIDALLINYRKPLSTRFSTIIQGEKRVAPEIIEEIIKDALTYRASDIHFEPQEQSVLIRFRVDGILQEAGRIPKDLYENVLNRFKVQAHLRIDDHFSAQDGSIRFVSKDESVRADMRLSITPSLDGEKVVIRLLAEYVRGFTLADLGMMPNDQETLEKASRKPFGMLLVVGPTGAGKSTTLYSLVKLLNRPEVNITTIEDPVEYKIIGVNQIQVNKDTNLTFAHGLRTIVRQDPDIILVGEIRDTETAEIAVNAALTGHLLLSTFHANDAATAIPRLLDMGVEPFLLASTLQIVMAQRLTRKICINCRSSYTVPKDTLLKENPILESFFPEGDITLYKGKGCSSCNMTGYKGRTCLFEIISVTPDMQDLILTNPSQKQIWELARKQGSRSLYEDGMDKVKNGITTLEEVLRIAAPPIKT